MNLGIKSDNALRGYGSMILLNNIVSYDSKFRASV